MPRKCTICNHTQRAEVDAALVRGTTLRELSALYRVSEDSLARHRDTHIAQSLLKAQSASEVARADDLLSQVKALQEKTINVLDKAEKAGDLRVVLQAVAQARSNLELLANLLGELHSDTATINVSVSPDWLRLRSLILKALEPYPEARTALVEALGGDRAG